MSSYAGYVGISPRDAFPISDSMTHDLVISTTSNVQRVLIGTSQDTASVLALNKSNVGIHTSNPQAALDIRHAPNETALKIANATGTPTLVVSEGRLEVGGNIVPSSGGVYNLGSESLRWNDIYLNANSIYLDNVRLSVQSGNVVSFSDNTGNKVTLQAILDLGNVTGNLGDANFPLHDVESNSSYFYNNNTSPYREFTINAQSRLRVDQIGRLTYRGNGERFPDEGEAASGSLAWPVNLGGTGTTALTPNKLMVGGSTTVATPSELTWDNNMLTIDGCVRTTNLQVDGNLIILGNTTTLNTETVLVEDNLIEVNSNVQTPLPSGFQSGIAVNRGVGQDKYYFVLDEDTQFFKVGLQGNLQAVATRDDTIPNNAIAFWDNTSKKYTYDTNVQVLPNSTVSVNGNVHTRQLNLGPVYSTYGITESWANVEVSIVEGSYFNNGLPDLADIFNISWNGSDGKPRYMSVNDPFRVNKRCMLAISEGEEALIGTTIPDEDASQKFAVTGASHINGALSCDRFDDGMEKNLVAFLAFKEGSGDFVRNTSKKGDRYEQLLGTWSANSSGGWLGPYITFNSTISYLKPFKPIGLPLISASSVVTVSLFFKWDGTNGATYSAILGGGNFSDHQHLSIRNSDSLLGFYDTTTFTPSSTAMAANQWYHLAVVMNGTSYNLYVNGVNTLSSNSFFNNASNNLTHIGNDSLEASAAYASYQHVMIWERELTQREIHHIGFQRQGNLITTDITTGHVAIQGSLGIGTSNPSASLHVNEGNIRLQGSGSHFIQVYTSTFTDHAVGIELMEAPNNGSVGFDIRYLNTLNKLEVNSHNSGVTKNVMTINRSDGNVGISNASPQALLHVSGDARIDSSLNVTKYITKTEYDAGSTGGSLSVNWYNGQMQKTLANLNTTISVTAANTPGVGHYQLRIVQDATGSRTVAWGGDISASRWLGSATAPAVNSAANGETIVVFFFDGTNFVQSLSKVGAA